MTEAPKRSSVRKYLRLIEGGALVGIFIAGWIAPGLLEWWVNPEIPGLLYTCHEAVRWASYKTMLMQAIGAGSMAILFVVAGIVLGSRRRRAGAQDEGGGTPPRAT